MLSQLKVLSDYCFVIFVYQFINEVLITNIYRYQSNAHGLVMKVVVCDGDNKSLQILYLFVIMFVSKNCILVYA